MARLKMAFTANTVKGTEDGRKKDILLREDRDKTGCNFARPRTRDRRQTQIRVIKNVMGEGESKKRTESRGDEKKNEVKREQLLKEASFVN